MAEIDVPYYFVRPTSPVRGGIVAIHEGNGMTLQMLRFCERLATEGYFVAAPDLFFRTGGPEAKEDYMEQVQEVQSERMLDDLAIVGRVLRESGAVRIGVMGFCMGGVFTWRAAVQRDGYDAAVGFYGAGIAGELGHPRCPTLLFFGRNDPWIPSQDIDTVAHHHGNTVVYPQAGHGFMRDGSEEYVPDAASDAWERMVAHFHQHLSS